MGEFLLLLSYFFIVERLIVVVLKVKELVMMVVGGFCGEGLNEIVICRFFVLYKCLENCIESLFFYNL